MTLIELIELKKELTRHDYRYYVLFQPTISDQAYDMLYKKYEKAVKELIGLDTRSLETQSLYPEWVQAEFKDSIPRT